MSTSSTPSSNSKNAGPEIYAKVWVHGMPMTRCLYCGHWNYVHDPECELNPQPQHPDEDPEQEKKEKRSKGKGKQKEEEEDGDLDEWDVWATQLIQSIRQIGASDS